LRRTKRDDRFLFSFVAILFFGAGLSVSRLMRFVSHRILLGNIFRRRHLPPVGLADEDDPAGAQAPR
jgi:hypothetical protein